MEEKKLNPGSDEAIKAGCTCPVLDNSHGKGYYMQEGIFVMVANCPIHGLEAKKILEKGKKK